MIIKLNLPSSLDLDNHLLEYPPINFKDFKEDVLAYILSLLIEIPAKNKDIRKIGGGWVPLYTPLLRNVVRNYYDYIQYALGAHYPDDAKAALLVTDNQYVKGEKSIYYRYVNNHIPVSGELQQRELTDKRLLKKLIKERQEKCRETQKIYPTLTRWFNEELAIDGENARNYAAYLRDKEMKQIAVSELAGPYSADELEKIRTHLHFKHLICNQNISSIENGDFSYSVDETGRRFHSNLTNLKKEFRNYLSYRGQKLVSIDVKNAQPFFSIVLLNRRFYQPPTDTEAKILQRIYNNELVVRPPRSLKLCNVAPELYKRMLDTQVKIPLSEPLKTRGKKIIKNTYKDKVSSLIMYSDYLEDSDLESVSKYKKLVVDGVFYDVFASEVNNHHGLSWDRKDAKKAMFKVFFTDNRYISTSEAKPKQLFKDLFPSIYDLFYKLKQKDKPALAILLQSIESWLILDVVCKRIYRERPDIPLFTIHDSIITTKENENFVKDVLVRAVQRYIGSEPALDVSYFCPNNLVEAENDLIVGELLLQKAS